MNELFTIGFAKKSAKEFFQLLKKNGINRVIDIRLNNTSQLAGFTKHNDLEFFLKEICGIKYNYDIMFAPDKDLLINYKNGNIGWDEYVIQFDNIMKTRNINEYISKNYSCINEERICLLCSEEKSDKCHRKLVADKFSKIFNISIVHL